MLKKKMEKLT